MQYSDHTLFFVLRWKYPFSWRSSNG